MKRERKIYDPAFKTKAVQLSNERTNVSELAREIGKLGSPGGCELLKLGSLRTWFLWRDLKKTEAHISSEAKV